MIREYKVRTDFIYEVSLTLISNSLNSNEFLKSVIKEPPTEHLLKCVVCNEDYRERTRTPVVTWAKTLHPLRYPSSQVEGRISSSGWLIPWDSAMSLFVIGLIAAALYFIRKAGIPFNRTRLQPPRLPSPKCHVPSPWSSVKVLARKVSLSFSRTHHCSNLL